jgi:hypothetical protein
MEILRSISLYAEANKLKFVLIGGHAINSYGISRQTGDIDLIVEKDKKTEWIDFFKKIKYQKGQDDDRFLRFKPDTLLAWPIDLMLVDSQTFDKIFKDAQDTELGTTAVKVASPRHLVTLKIHALKYYQEHRFVKDYNDLLQLLRTKVTDLRGADLQELCLKYANNDLYDKIKRDLGN